jgi:hypothetical protein
MGAAREEKGAKKSSGLLHDGRFIPMPGSSRERTRFLPNFGRTMMSFTCRWALCAALAFLVGCSSSPASAPSAPVGPWSLRLAQHVHPDRARSWMLAEAKNENLLYVSDASTYDVYAFSYPKGKLVGELTDQNNPGGLCVDAKGDLFVTQLYGGGHIVEYPHGGSTPIESLSDPGYEPGGCSVDPTTGNLAVSNIITDSFGTGDLLVFKNATGTPTTYPAPPETASGGEWGSVNTVGYDDKGNIFVAGHGYPDANVFAELPKGASKLENLTLDQNFGSGIGNVQWDGTYITFASISGSLYRFKIKGTVGKVVGSTILKNSNQDDQGWIQGNVVVAPQQEAKEVFLYKYPAGGNPTKTITGLSEPFGTTVSLAKSK